MQNADYWINKLQLLSHPEGGYYRETYRSKERATANCLPDRFEGARNFSTAIYFLLRSTDRSLFHRIKSDEIWHFYAGSSLTLYILTNTAVEIVNLGASPEKKESLQVVIPGNCWFAAFVPAPDSYVLAGCTVAPGFDFRDFELADRHTLLAQFPLQKDVIELFTAP
jgi:uncharacterized protein